ncbi:C40 family peptidase [Modicisalibacter radicis]|uniref:C40 family peptidase n=1 Tax=Halomonas sp. EAR18 TaxID=2518972 RepID=UPI001FCE37D9|nr:NlpC/P60 family protein [Halomonas sp. EAR18]
MRRAYLSCLMITVLLAGCAGGPASRPSTSGATAGQSALRTAWQIAPSNQMAEQLQRLREASPELIRTALLDEHRRWVGTPYVLGGEGFQGIDCSALVQRVFNEAFALALPRTTDDQVLEGQRIDRDSLKAGDLVFFRPPGPYNHVGIYVGSGRFLHASSSQGVIISRLDNVYWQRYYWQARRPMTLTELAQRARQYRQSRSG